MLIRVEGDLSPEVTDVFPQLSSRSLPRQSTLTGELADQEELQGVLHYLHTLGIAVLEVVTIPED
jgi:hypothetical protein